MLKTAMRCENRRMKAIELRDCCYEKVKYTFRGNILLSCLLGEMDEFCVNMSRPFTKQS